MIKTDFYNQLVQHIKLGRKTEVLSLLEGTDPCHFIGEYKSTLLHLAAKYDNKDLSQHLIDLEADVDAQNNIGETPLIIAVKYEHEEIVKVLLKANADICKRDIFGQFILGRAFDKMEEMKGSMRKLILNSITVEYVCKVLNKSTAFLYDCPLYNIVSLENIELTRVLLEKGSPIDVGDSKTGRTALHVAVMNLDVDHVKLLVEYHANVNGNDYSRERPLALITDYTNAGKRAVEIVKILLNAGAQFHHWSILSNGNRQIIQTVLQCPHVNLNEKLNGNRNSKVLDYLLENKNPGVYEELVKSEVDLKTYSSDKKTLLHHAAAKGIASLVQLLLKRRGADVNCKDSNNYTPLHMAINPLDDVYPKGIPFNGEELEDKRKIDRINCIKILLENGADPQVFTDDINFNYIIDFHQKICRDRNVTFIKPVLNHLALQEASGRKINLFMLYQIECRREWYNIFYLSKKILLRMQNIKIDRSVTLFDFFIVERVSLFVDNKIFIANLTRTMNNYRNYGPPYYHSVLKERFLKLIRMSAIYDVFVKFYNVSVINIAEKIVGYL